MSEVQMRDQSKSRAFWGGGITSRNDFLVLLCQKKLRHFSADENLSAIKEVFDFSSYNNRLCWMRHGDRQNSEHLSSTRFLFYSYHSFTWVTTPTVIIHKEILCFRDVSSDQLETSLRICQILPRSFKFNLHKASRKRSIQTNVIMCLRRKIPEASAPLTYFRNQKFDH